MTGPSTRAVHAATRTAPGIVGGVDRSTTFALDAAGLADVEATGGQGTWYYSRLANPTVVRTAAAVAAIEGAESALLLASGMAAIDVALTVLVPPGGRLVVASELYGDTLALLRGEWAAAGRACAIVDATDPPAVRAALADGADALLVEAISNPMLRVPDLPALAALAHDAGALALVDATFATPFNVRPLAHGFDLVLHSATKYLNGHSDVIAGVVAGSRALVGRIAPRAALTGATLDPGAAALLERGLRTLAVRMERHNANGLAVARWLEACDDVRRVDYPGLPSHPDHATAGRLLRGGSGLVSFTPHGGPGRGRRVVERLALITHAASLGGVESLVCLPRVTSHAALAEDELDRLGIGPSTLRLSLGIEDPEDLIADVAQALAATREEDA